jgi:molecular chaperone GrpE
MADKEKEPVVQENGAAPAPAPKKEAEEALERALSEGKEFKDKYLRALAEMENSRKRLTREKLESQTIAVQSVVSDFLEPLDHLEQALKHASSFKGDVAVWAQGFQMILQQFHQVLESYDVISFSSVGMLFDPNLHEAIEVEENADAKEGTILHEFKKGYKMGSKTVRAAKVRVAQLPKEPNAEDINNKKE